MLPLLICVKKLHIIYEMMNGECINFHAFARVFMQKLPYKHVYLCIKVLHFDFITVIGCSWCR